MHGRLSAVYLQEEEDEDGLFKDIRNPVEVVRYHSLVVEPEGRGSLFAV
jgi:anthranilate/para-aminobenzoate synthase component II